jgi:lipopolysaccharide export LptBFGC system permease protein LptF
MKFLQKLAIAALALAPVASSYAEKFVQNGTEYILNPELRAQFLARGDSNTNLFQSGNVFFKTKNFVILKQTKNESILKSYSVQNDQDTKSYPVVYDTKTKQYGIMQGHFIVKMKDGGRFTDSAFTISKEYPDFNAYVVDIPQDQSIQISLDRLKADQNVDRVNVEISEVFREAM